MFKSVPDNIVLCINEANIPRIYGEISNKTCYIEDCTDDWKMKQKKFINGTEQCVDNCPNAYPYEYNGQCYSECTNGYFIDDNHIIKCKCELEKCLTCPTVALNKQLCSKCNDNYYPMENDPLNLGEYFNCYNEIPAGYYLDTNDKLYKKCFYTCETCKIKGDNEFHNCLKCNDEFIFAINNNNYFNCVKNCSYYYYLDNNNYYHCTENLACPPEYSKLIQDKNLCVSEGIKSLEIFIDNILNSETNETNIKMGKEVEINKYNKILEKIDMIFTSDNYDLTNIDKGEDQIINTNKMQIVFTNTEKKKILLKSNLIIIMIKF